MEKKPETKEVELPFVEKIRSRMGKIEATLTHEERLKYQSQIDMIYRLLDLFESTGGISKEIKKRLDDSTKHIQDAIKHSQLITTKGLTPTKPNIDMLDTDTINKANMAKASQVFLETNGNEMATNEILKNTGYKVDTELSTPEAIVIHDGTDVKVAFRGTDSHFSKPFESVKDLVHDARFLTGTEAYGRGGGLLESGRNIISSAINKYGRENVNEIVGHSMGGQKAILLGDQFNIETTTFNPLIGYNSMKSSKTATTHNIFRTTEDITSLGAGFGTYKDNWKVKSILPKKISLDPRKAHLLSNFEDNEGRFVGDSPLNTKIAKVVSAGKKKAQVEDLNDTIDILSDRDKLDRQLGDDFYEQQLEANYPTSQELLDESEFPDVPRDRTQQVETEQDRRNLRQLEERMANIRDEPLLGGGSGLTPVPMVEGAPPPPPKAIRPSKDSIGDKIRAYESNIFDEVETPIPSRSSDPLGDEIRSSESKIFGEEQSKPVRENVFNPDDFKNKNARAMIDMRKGEFESFKLDPKEPSSQEVLPTKEYRGKASDIDLGIFKKTTPSTDIDFDDITDFFRSNTTKGDGADLELSSLNDGEIDNLIKGSTKDRDIFEEITNDDFNSAVKNLDDHISIPSGEGNLGSMGTDLMRALHPTNLLGGLGAGIVSASAMNFIDPNQDIQKQVRETMVGTGAGLLTGFGSGVLGGAGFGMVAPEAVAGGLGYLAGEEVASFTKQATGSDFLADVTGGVAGGGVGGLALGIGGGIAADVAAGATFGTFFDPITMGTGTLIGGAVGAAIGGIAYGIHKLFD